MFDAFKIGITLALTNKVSDGLKLMVKDFDLTEKRAAALESQLGLGA